MHFAHLLINALYVANIIDFDVIVLIIVHMTVVYSMVLMIMVNDIRYMVMCMLAVLVFINASILLVRIHNNDDKIWETCVRKLAKYFESFNYKFWQNYIQCPYLFADLVELSFLRVASTPTHIPFRVNTLCEERREIGYRTELTFDEFYKEHIRIHITQTWFPNPKMCVDKSVFSYIAAPYERAFVAEIFAKTYWLPTDLAKLCAEYIARDPSSDQKINARDIYENIDCDCKRLYTLLP
jgi:hypothetical protein